MSMWPKFPPVLNLPTKTTSICTPHGCPLSARLTRHRVRCSHFSSNSTQVRGIGISQGGAEMEDRSKSVT